MNVINVHGEKVKIVKIIAQYCSQIPRNIVHNGCRAIMSTMHISLRNTVHRQWILRNTVHRHCAILPTPRVIQRSLVSTTETSFQLIGMTFIITTILYVPMTVCGHLHLLQFTKTILTFTQRFKGTNTGKTDAHLNCRLHKNILGTSKKTHFVCSIKTNRLV